MCEPTGFFWSPGFGEMFFCQAFPWLASEKSTRREEVHIPSKCRCRGFTMFYKQLHWRTWTNLERKKMVDFQLTWKWIPRRNWRSGQKSIKNRICHHLSASSYQYMLRPLDHFWSKGIIEMTSLCVSGFLSVRQELFLGPDDKVPGNW